MTNQVQTRLLRKSARQKLQDLIRKRVWQMDVDPTAWIAPSALIDRTWPKGVHIGANCVIDHQAVILTHDMTRGLYLDTTIGAGSVIGARAIIMPGVTVGNGCRVAPGAVVLHDIPEGATVQGNPAAIV